MRTHYFAFTGEDGSIQHRAVIADNASQALDYMIEASKEIGLFTYISDPSDDSLMAGVDYERVDIRTNQLARNGHANAKGSTMGIVWINVKEMDGEPYRNVKAFQDGCYTYLPADSAARLITYGKIGHTMITLTDYAIEARKVAFDFLPDEEGPWYEMEPNSKWSYNNPAGWDHIDTSTD